MESKYILYYLASKDLDSTFLSIRNSVGQKMERIINNFGCKDYYILKDHLDISKDFEVNNLAFCICSCFCNMSSEYIEEVNNIIKYGIPVLPVFNPKDGNYDSIVPECLKPINALNIDSNDIEKSTDRIISYILEGFGLIRQERKVFISYKRSEARAIAVQLYDSLNHLNYRVFLDTASIRHGSDFQKRLMNELSDSDILIFLNSEKAFESEWVKEEYINAYSQRIGIVHVDWPNSKKTDKELNACVDMTAPIQLTEEYFTNYGSPDSLLSEEILSKILFYVEQLRIKNLAARKTHLITEFCNIRNNSSDSKLVFSPFDQMIIDEKGNQDQMMYYPVLGIPKSEDFNQVRKKKTKLNGTVSILYNKMLVEEEYLDYLNWIDENTPIKLTGFIGMEKEDESNA